MAVVAWNHELEAHPRLDEQHRTQMETASFIAESMKEGRDPEEIRGHLNFLLGYTQAHFRNEEELMGRHGYPGMDLHVQVHAHLIYQMEELIARYDAGNHLLSSRLMEFVQNLLHDHVQGEDLKLGEFLRKRGATR